MNPTVFFIVGPTATGKSKVAVLLAKKMKGEIISADSMQFYRGMDIGTAKPSRQDQKKIPHHLVDIRSPRTSFSASHFRKLALKAIEDILKRKRVPIVVGGSGLYVRFLLEGVSKQPGADPKVRKKYYEQVEKKGVGFLYRKLKKIDPKSASKIKSTDTRRIVRAFEIWEQSKTKPSKWYEEKVSLKELGYTPVVLGIAKERSWLYEDVEKRVDKMFRQGLVKEVKSLMRRKFISKTARQAIGYKEILEALKPKQSSKELAFKLTQAKELIKLRTRRFAKRQMTWFRKEKGIQWFERRRGESDTGFVGRLWTHFRPYSNL